MIFCYLPFLSPNLCAFTHLSDSFSTCLLTWVSCIQLSQKSLLCSFWFSCLVSLPSQYVFKYFLLWKLYLCVTFWYSSYSLHKFDLCSLVRVTSEHTDMVGSSQEWHLLLFDLAGKIASSNWLLHLKSASRNLVSVYADCKLCYTSERTVPGTSFTNFWLGEHLYTCPCIYTPYTRLFSDVSCGRANKAVNSKIYLMASAASAHLICHSPMDYNQ